MPIRLKIANSTHDRATVYRLRRRIFVDEEKRFAHDADHIIDQYDSFAETTNVLALLEDRPIASIRVIMENAVGSPTDEFYDFGTFRAQLDGRCAYIGWLCCEQRYRRHPGLIIGLIKMCFREMRKCGARHVLATLHPPVMPMLERIVGARLVGPEFHSPALNVAMLPIHVDLKHLPPGGRETFADPSQQILEDSTERRIYRRSEVIIQKDTVGEEAFLIMRGSVRAIVENAAGADWLDGPMFGPGQIIGELSLLDGGPRTVTLVAYSNEVDVMVWTREELLQQLRASQDKALQVLELLGARLRHQIEARKTTPPVSLAARILLDTSRQGKLPVKADWLSRQCGIGGHDFDNMLRMWEQRGWIRIDQPNGRVFVDDHRSLGTQVDMP
ncbi:MAG: cyclic nucleotide-binding domain-containing protein [Desulfobacterales bacterium]|jgi:CRP-like cAMP-binding protein